MNSKQKIKELEETLEKIKNEKDELQLELDMVRHIQKVSDFCLKIAKEFEDRALLHDRSKLGQQEFKLYKELLPEMKKHKFGSKEYNEVAKKFQFHFDNNPSHHPQAHKNGINDMNLFDMLEMFADWASVGSNMNESILTNAQRFGMSQQLVTLFRNTAEWCGLRWPVKVVIQISLDEEPLTEEEENKVREFLAKAQIELKSGVKLTEEEKADKDLLIFNFTSQGCYHFNYYFSTQEEYAKFFVSELKTWDFLNKADIWYDKPTGQKSGWQEPIPDKRIKNA